MVYLTAFNVFNLPTILLPTIYYPSTDSYLLTTSSIDDTAPY